MLYVHTISTPEGTITNTNYYFIMRKSKDWFNRQDVKDIILGIDKTVAVKDEYLESPVFGGMAPDRLSGGCKIVILLTVEDNPVDITGCGENCAPYICELAKKKDIHVVLHYNMMMPPDVEAVFVDTNEHVHSSHEFAVAYYFSGRGGTPDKIRTWERESV